MISDNPTLHDLVISSVNFSCPETTPDTAKRITMEEEPSLYDWAHGRKPTELPTSNRWDYTDVATGDPAGHATFISSDEIEDKLVTAAYYSEATTNVSHHNLAPVS